MPANGSFIILNQVDSTNNYAMAMVHEGLAKHGEAVFSHYQTAGKGQRGKAWQMEKDQNIALSVVMNPKELKLHHPFQLSLVVALASYDFFSKYAGDETCIKWPNDIYWRDRKSGGILIESLIRGRKWKWAVVGVGLNINQTHFGDNLKAAVSLKQITGKNFDPVELARELHQNILNRSQELLIKPFKTLLEEYQERLYKMNTVVKLKKDNRVFETLIKGVSTTGQLLTFDVIEKQIEFGEVEWVL